MSLDGFEQINIGSTGLSVSITKNGTTFNKNVVQKLGSPMNVVIMVNAATRQFAIRAANSKDTNCMPFFNGEKTNSVRWNSKELLRIFSSLTGWDLKKCSGYRVPGTYSPSDKAVIFDLENATPN